MALLHYHPEAYQRGCFLCQLDDPDYASLEDIGYNPHNGNTVEHYVDKDGNGYVRVINAGTGEHVTFTEHGNSNLSCTRFVIEVGIHPAQGGDR